MLTRSMGSEQKKYRDAACFMEKAAIDLPTYVYQAVSQSNIWLSVHILCICVNLVLKPLS